MAPRKRRSTRQLQELPGLFDDISVTFPEPDPVRKIIDEHRKEQESVHGLHLGMDPASLHTRHELQFISFGSGSSGNCAYLGVANQGGVLIDAGVEVDTVLEGLRQNAIPLSDVKGILLTHDHRDHVGFAYALLRKLRTGALYCTPRTLNGILRRHSISRRIKDYHKAIYKEFAFEVGPFTVLPFEVSHDGTDNVGFCVAAENRRFVVATDLGTITDRADHYMRMADYLMIETNYDDAMLEVGPYPEYLKARIRGDRGHLGNHVTAEYLAGMWTPVLSEIYLCHLSQDNNKPELALAAVRSKLQTAGAIVGDDSGDTEARAAQVRLRVLPRRETSPLYVHRLK